MAMASASMRSEKTMLKERLLFNRITLQGPHISRRDIEDAAPVKPDSADAVFPLADETPVAARVTTDLLIGEFFIKNPLFGMVGEKLF